MIARIARLALLCVLSAVASMSARGVEAQSALADSVAADELVAAAEAFMAAYADDLRSGDRSALGHRYDPDGTRELRPGRARSSSREDIAGRYAGAWQPPSRFEWRDLTYEVVGPDRVLVSGLFEWTVAAGSAPEVESYAALLRRLPSGEMVISLEAEAGLPQIPWLVLGAAAVFLTLVAAAIGWVIGSRRNPRLRQRSESRLV